MMDFVKAGAMIVRIVLLAAWLATMVFACEGFHWLTPYTDKSIEDNEYHYFRGALWASAVFAPSMIVHTFIELIKMDAENEQ